MGYDTSLLVVQPEDVAPLICGVCTDLFETPVQVCPGGCTLCESCAMKVKPRKCPLCRKQMKPAKSLVPNFLIAQMVDKVQTRCVNGGNGGNGGGGGGGGGEPAKKKIKTSASAAASVPSVDGCPWIGPIGGLKMHEAECGFVKVGCTNAACPVSVYRHELASHAAVCAFRRVPCAGCGCVLPPSALVSHVELKCPKCLLACPNDGCALASPADRLPSHRTVCPSETIKCGFGGGKCDGTYKRGVGSGDHDREAAQVHLNIAMGVIDALARANEAQTRMIEDMRTEMKTTQAASARDILHLQMQTARQTVLYLAGTVSAVTLLTSLVSPDNRFLGNTLELSVVEDSATKTTSLSFEIVQGMETTFKEIEVSCHGKVVATHSDVALGYGSVNWTHKVWCIDAKTATSIKKGTDVHVIIHA
jgi:hypothetical protein